MAKVRNYSLLDIEGKQALRDMLPSDVVDLFKVTLLRSFYDLEYKVDGIFKTPPDIGDYMFLFDIKTNAVHQDSLSFTVVDKQGNKWRDKPKADIYIFVFREKKKAYFLTIRDLERVLNGKYQIKSSYNISRYVWLSKSELSKSCSLALSDGIFTLPDGDSSAESIKKKIKQDFLYEAARNSNPIKKMDLDKIYDGLCSIEHV